METFETDANKDVSLPMSPGIETSDAPEHRAFVAAGRWKAVRLLFSTLDAQC
jgi:hypothetical protein